MLWSAALHSASQRLILFALFAVGRAEFVSKKNEMAKGRHKDAGRILFYIEIVLWLRGHGSTPVGHASCLLKAKAFLAAP